MGSNPILQSRVKGEAETEKFARDVGALIDRPINDVYVTAAAQTATERVLTLQVRDRVKSQRLGRHLVAVWAATASGGAPSGTPTFAAPTAGALIQDDGDVYIYVTDEDGVVEVQVTSAAATLYFNAIWLGRPGETSLIWT